MVLNLGSTGNETIEPALVYLWPSYRILKVLKYNPFKFGIWMIQAVRLRGGHFNFSRDYEGDSKCIGGKCYFSFDADFTHESCNSGAYGGSDIQAPGKFYEVYHKQGWFNGVESAGDTFCYDETDIEQTPLATLKQVI